MIQREAMFYETMPESMVQCHLCPHKCVLRVGESGKCRGRKNMSGKMIAINYGLSIGISLDPIEKKPLYHFHPGTRIVSLGANSCNLSCFFCQNYQSSQSQCETQYLSPKDLYEIVKEHSQNGIKQIAFTYTEPFTWYEYIYDFACLAEDTDIVLVTNGFINPEPLEKILPDIKAMNIDLKSINPEFYSEHCGGDLEMVINTIKTAYAHGVHLEVTNLLIPGLNDAAQEMIELSAFIASVNREIPLHISAYHPAYKSKVTATSQKTVLQACEIARARLAHVYAGNIISDSFSATKCSNCGLELISANRKSVNLVGLGNCPHCSKHLYGVF